MQTQANDSWDAADAYEQFMGRWSRPLGEAFVAWLGAPPGGHWLDVGTGTGALASAICALASPASVVACDPSPAFIDAGRARLANPRVKFTLAGVGSLPRREQGYDSVVSGLALNFFPDPQLAIMEQLDMLRPGGFVGAFVWDYASGMEFLRIFWEAAARVAPRAAHADEGLRFPICNPDRLAELFSSAGAAHLRGTSLSVATAFSSFEDFWRPFLGGAGPAPSLVATLSETQRAALEDDLRHRLDSHGVGKIALQARAWAVVGYRS